MSHVVHPNPLANGRETGRNSGSNFFLIKILPVMKLTSRQIELSKPKDKNYSLTDGGGLSLLVHPDGSKAWLFRYTRPNGTRNSILMCR